MPAGCLLTLLEVTASTHHTAPGGNHDERATRRRGALEVTATTQRAAPGGNQGDQPTGRHGALEVTRNGHPPHPAATTVSGQPAAWCSCRNHDHATRRTRGQPERAGNPAPDALRGNPWTSTPARLRHPPCPKRRPRRTTPTDPDAKTPRTQAAETTEQCTPLRRPEAKQPRPRQATTVHRLCPGERAIVIHRSSPGVCPQRWITSARVTHRCGQLLGKSMWTSTQRHIFVHRLWTAVDFLLKVLGTTSR